MPMDVVILAAGKGKRMLSDTPKVLQPLGGVPLLQHVLWSATALNPRQIHVVCGNRAEQVKAAISQPSLNWVEQAQQLGTGHAVLQALPACDPQGRVLVLYGDVPLVSPHTLQTFLAATENDPVAVLVADLNDPTGFGRIVRDANGRLVRIVEQRDATPAELAITQINTGIVVCQTQHLLNWLPKLQPHNQQGELYLTDIIDMAVAAGLRVGSQQVADPIETLGVNDLWQLAELERAYQRRYAKQLALAGVRVVDPNRLDIRGTDIHIEAGVTLEPNVMLVAPVRIGKGSSIGPNVCLQQVEIGEQVTVLANSVIEGARIAAGASIGPFARLRPGTVIEGGAKVGNFVEIKKTVLGPGSKASHLTYLGDAIIEANVNIGAGTITCNYDGVNKWTTLIKSGAFIGSNTALVAPVTVGSNATVGAGTTLTRDAPDDKLTLSRSRQLTVPGWQRPGKQPTTDA